MDLHQDKFKSVRTKNVKKYETMKKSGKKPLGKTCLWLHKIKEQKTFLHRKKKKKAQNK